MEYRYPRDCETLRILYANLLGDRGTQEGRGGGGGPSPPKSKIPRLFDLLTPKNQNFTLDFGKGKTYKILCNINPRDA